MRMAFLPVVALLAGGVAWGQSASGVTDLSARVISQAPLVVQAAQIRSAQPLALTAQNGPVLLTLPTSRNARQQASGPEPIPTQWPHAKLEPIPTQWKAQVVLVGGASARPTGPSKLRDAGGVVTPR